MDTKALPKISSFAAPTDADLAVMQNLSDDDKRVPITAELERRGELPARSITQFEVLRDLRSTKLG